MSSQNRIGFVLVAVVVISIAVLVFNRDTRASDDNSIGDVAISCGPSQRAVIQKSHAPGSTAQVHVLCVDAAGMQPMAYATQDAAPLAPVTYSNAPVAAMPAVVYASGPAVAQAVPVAQAPRVLSAPARRVERKPSVQKRLLVIGGASGVGAGIGALVGGKKGALIGAAIGGGGATVVDQVRNR
jgi:uncharacterized protein YcfJ